MNHDELVKYVRRGMRKGFNTDYLAEELRKHGHDPKAIHKAINHATGGPQKEKQQGQLKAMIGFLAIILVVLLASLILSYSNQQKQISILQTQVDLTQQTARHYLEELDKLSTEIELKDQNIRQSIQQVDDPAQAAEFESILDSLKDLHEDIKEERKQTRDLLWELLNKIIERGNLEAEYQSTILEIENGEVTYNE